MGKKKEVVIEATAPVKATAANENQPQTVSEKVKAVKRQRRVRGHKYVALKNQIAPKTYALEEAVKLIKEANLEQFDATVELHLNLLENNLKGEVNLPHGTGKEVRIAIFSNEVEDKIKSNKIDFDILLASPKDMAKLVKYAKVLGPKGLMPSPKKGTLTDNIEAAKAKLSSGVVLYKAEPKFPLMHQMVGKKSFTNEALVENVKVFIKTVGKKNIADAFLKSSMSPSVKLDLSVL